MSNKLTNPATGHEINVDNESVDFWKTAGYRSAEPQKPKAAKKSSPSKSKK